MFSHIKEKQVILMGGLGNQLFQYAYSLALSFESETEVRLNPNLATIRTNDSGRPEIAQYNLDSKISLELPSNSPRLVRRFLGTGLRLSGSHYASWKRFVGIIVKMVSEILISLYLKKLVRIKFSENTGFSDRHLQKEPSIHIGYFQSYKYSESKEVMLALKKLTPKNLNPRHLGLVNLALVELPLVVHIRLADYRNESNFGILSKDYYKSAIDYQLHNYLYKKIWLFSDEPDEALDFIPVDFRGKVRNISEEISDPVWTLEAMRLGKGYVIANSTFSWWGAYLSRTDDPVTVYPNPWFQGMSDPMDLCPPSWKPISR